MYYRARYYFPGFGRFTQRDPVDMAGGINAYAYVANNPANLVDPLGLRATDPIDRQIAQASATYVSDVDIGVNDYGDVSGAQLAQFVLPPVRVAPPVPAQGSQSLNQLGGRRDTDPGQQLLNEAGQGIRPPVGITSTGTGTDLVNKMSTEIRGITERTDLGPQGEVYSLRATRGAEYPNVRGGTTRLEVGDVYKFGETSQPDSRYSSTDLQRMGLRYQEEYRGSQTMAKIVEKLRIYGHVLESGQLPPGNRIFR